MTQNENCLFLYLEKENIAIDKSEFLFQVQSHPNFPSLLAISDTLNFFTIDNGAISVASSEINLLPNRFIALLRDDDNFTQSYFVEKKGNKYFYTSNSKSKLISKAELEAKWHGIVLLVEKSATTIHKFTPKKNGVLFILLISVFFGSLFLVESSLEAKLFIIFPIIGLLFSIAALKDLFGTKSKLLNDFCNITTSTSCSSIINSDKWKFFKYVNFSDLSIVFFSTQFIGVFFFLFSGIESHFYYIQEILLLISVPIIFLSLYFQKFVENKWCPICLAIMSIIIVEISYLKLTMLPGSTFISITSVGLFALILSFVSIFWRILKKNILKLKELKEFQFKANRFARNYEIFKNTLIAKGRMELTYSPIILGNKKSKIEIAIITNPFCGYCKEAHEILEEILNLYKDELKIKILINADIENAEEDKKILYRVLMSTYLEKGEKSFLKVLNNWFLNPNLKRWIDAGNSSLYEHEKIDTIYKSQHQWCIDNNSFQTPSLFINNYRYPKFYDRDNLKYFINDIIEDSDFN